jgi:hypothetical protein
LSTNPYVLIEEEKKNHDKKIKDDEDEMEEVFSRKEKLVRWQTQEISFIEKEQDEIKKERETTSWG